MVVIGVQFGHLFCVQDTDDVQQKNNNHETIPSRFSLNRKQRSLLLCVICNLRSGPILAVLIHSLSRLPLKLDLIQTHSCLHSLRPDFGRNANWLLEQCHKIWLAVGNARSWKRLFLAWLFSWMIRRRWREGSILLSFYCFMVLWYENKS